MSINNQVGETFTEVIDYEDCSVAFKPVKGPAFRLVCTAPEGQKESYVYGLSNLIQSPVLSVAQRDTTYGGKRSTSIQILTKNGIAQLGWIFAENKGLVAFKSED